MITAGSGNQIKLHNLDSPDVIIGITIYGVYATFTPNIAHRSRRCGRTGEGLKASSAAEQLPPPGGSAPACERALYDWDDPDRRLAPDVVAASGDR